MFCGLIGLGSDICCSFHVALGCIFVMFMHWWNDSEWHLLFFYVVCLWQARWWVYVWCFKWMVYLLNNVLHSAFVWLSVVMSYLVLFGFKYCY